MDVGAEADCQAVTEQAWQIFGALDVLVNNAGIIRRTPTEQTTIEAWEAVLRVNLTGTFLMTREAIPFMRRSGGGCIVNISSRAAKRPHRNATPAYGASKAAILYLTRHFALEYAKENIRVNALCPGPVETEMFHQLDETKRRQTIEEIPLGRIAVPREIGEAVLFLASELSEFITGETIHINGGSFME
jgi:3-oxoacyl-[acyl-carrier protein] reductase